MIGGRVARHQKAGAAITPLSTNKPTFLNIEIFCRMVIPRCFKFKFGFLIHPNDELLTYLLKPCRQSDDPGVDHRVLIES
jgi:hypothetical protein